MKVNSINGQSYGHNNTRQANINPSFCQVYRPAKESLKQFLEKDTFVNFVLDFCTKLENKGYGSLYDVKFIVPRVLESYKEIARRFIYYKINKVGCDEYIEEFINPAHLLDSSQTYNECLSWNMSHFEEQIQKLEKFHDNPSIKRDTCSFAYWCSLEGKRELNNIIYKLNQEGIVTRRKLKT